MSKKQTKTNAMRILDRQKIPYELLEYDCETFVDGQTVARQLGLEVCQVYKTLVTLGKSKEHYVFVIPVAQELDLKKAAEIVHEKSIEMLPTKELLGLTGYERGGCTSIGMKKSLPVWIDEDAKEQNKIYVSAGKKGVQIRIAPLDLQLVTSGTFASLTRKELS